MNMTNEQILKKAIEKAEDNGFIYSWRDQSGNDNMPKDWWFDRSRYFQVIFSHNFAKAFWKRGKGSRIYNDFECGPDLKSWQIHLQQMVVEENPIKYLKKYIA